MLVALMRQLCKHTGIHYHKLLFIARGEFGEIGGRFHYHVLVAGVPPVRANVLTCLWLKDRWEEFRFNPNAPVTMAGDHARIYLYTPTLDGVGYLQKGLERYTHQCEANAYELRKFGLSDEVTLSESLIQRAQRRNIGEGLNVQTAKQAVRLTPKQGLVESKVPDGSESKALAEREKHPTYDPAKIASRFEPIGAGLFRAIA